MVRCGNQGLSYAIIGGNQWSAVEVRDSLALKGTAISGGASMTKPRDETDETHLACLVRGDTRAYLMREVIRRHRVDEGGHQGTLVRTTVSGLGSMTISILVVPRLKDLEFERPSACTPS